MPFHYDKETMTALHFGFVNFCTDRGTAYRDRREMTPFTIFIRPLARNGDVLPECRVNPNNRDIRISIPIQNEVVRGYMERIEKVRVSSSNISQMKRKYQNEIWDIHQAY